MRIYQDLLLKNWFKCMINQKLCKNGVKIDNAEDLDVVMPMYNLLKYSKNYRKTTGSLWNYFRV